MSTELRNFLALTYDELEDLNLRAKEQRKNRVPAGQNPGRAAQVPHRRKAHQGRDRAVQRPRRPPAHARLRQEVPAEELRQPDLRRLLDSRLHRAARERSPAGHRLAVFYWAPADVFGPGKVLVFGDVIDKGGSAVPGRHARRAQNLCRTALQEGRLHPQRGQRNRRLPLQRRRRRAALSTRPASSNTSTPAATITRCPAIRCARSSTPPPKCSAPWASRTRRTIPRSRPRSSRSTTAIRKWWPPPTRSSSTS